MKKPREINKKLNWCYYQTPWRRTLSHASILKSTTYRKVLTDHLLSQLIASYPTFKSSASINIGSERDLKFLQFTHCLRAITGICFEWHEGQGFYTFLSLRTSTRPWRWQELHQLVKIAEVNYKGKEIKVRESWCSYIHIVWTVLDE